MAVACAHGADPQRCDRACGEAGHVRVNGARVLAPSHLLRRGDVVTLALDRSVRVLRVDGLLRAARGRGGGRALYQLVPELERGLSRQAALRESGLAAIFRLR